VAKNGTLGLPAVDMVLRTNEAASNAASHAGQKVVNLSITEAQWPLFQKAVAVTVEVRTDDGSGAGVVLSPDGLILTAYHVIRGAKWVRVRRCSLHRRDKRIVRRGSYLADVIVIDRRADIALLKLRRPPKGLRGCRLGDANALSLKAPLYRVGRDKVPLAAGYLMAVGKFKGVNEFEIGMPNAPGASGGPVFDEQGRVVAIALRGNFDTKLPPSSFAIPINTVATRLFRDAAVRKLLGEQ